MLVVGAADQVVDGATGRREPTVMSSVPSAAELIHLGMDTSVKEIVAGVLRPGEEVPVITGSPAMRSRCGGWSGVSPTGGCWCPRTT
jgi:hypothetical protein